MTVAALEVDHLRVIYPNGNVALDDVSFSIPEGGRLGLVGRSGSGKSTLIRAILGLLPTGSRVEGSITVGGESILGLDRETARSQRGTLIGYVGQDPYAACDPLRTVRHHVEEAWFAHRRKPPVGAVVDGLTEFGIAEAERRVGQRPHQWSGGMLQRATTLAATVHHPALTLADEPTSALDTQLADSALELLRKTCSSLLLVSHDLALVARHALEIVVLSGGQIVERGEAKGLFASPQHEMTRELIEASAPLPLGRSNAEYGDVAVEVKGVVKGYNVAGVDTVAMDGVDLTIRRGELVGIVGQSGSGKSTLLKVASGQERPDHGEVLWDGAPVWVGRNTHPRRPRNGWVMPVFQDPVASLDRRWPLWRTITEPLVLQGTRMSKDELRALASEKLEAVGLGEIDVNRQPGSLSGGQCQRVAVVRALIANPAFIVADEPTASLDVNAAAAVGDLLRAAADQGAAVLVVSHDEARLRSYADRVVRMASGNLE